MSQIGSFQRAKQRLRVVPGSFENGGGGFGAIAFNDGRKLGPLSEEDEATLLRDQRDVSNRTGAGAREDKSFTITRDVDGAWLVQGAA